MSRYVWELFPPTHIHVEISICAHKKVERLIVGTPFTILPRVFSLVDYSSPGITCTKVDVEVVLGHCPKLPSTNTLGDLSTQGEGSKAVIWEE